MPPAAPTAPPEYHTLADVVRALGDVPLHRILWHPHPGTATEEDIFRYRRGGQKLLAELVDGVLVLKAVGRDTLKEIAPDVETLADVIERLGGVPLDRILWDPRPGTATEADQIRLVDGEPRRLVELIDGILVEKAVGNREALFAATLMMFLMNFIRPRRLGVVGAPDAILRMSNGRNRLPDVYFTPWDRLPSDTAHLRSVAHYPPDLAVEILSEGNTRQEIDQKRREYFATGARLVWVINPDARTVEVYADPRQPDLVTLLRDTDTLDGGAVLPGFALPLADLFNDPQLNPRP
jgi:Uma2 family endonuclease